MTTISVEIPKLAVGQTVEAWKSLFEAATASLKPEQRIALLPNYIDRTPGDHEVAKLGAQEDTLQAAFVIIETLIDGERTKYKSVNEFCDMKPKDDLQSLYFKLKKIGKLAGLCNSFVFTRFLGLIPRGKKFFRDNEAEIDKETLSDSDMLKLYVKLKQLHDKSIDEDTPRKSQPRQEDYAFTGEEPTPSWAQELKNDVMMLKACISRQDTSESDSDEDDDTEQECYQTAMFKPNKTPTRQFRDQNCYECGKSGHFASDCYKRKCSNCNGNGHSYKQCPTKRRVNRKKL